MNCKVHAISTVVSAFSRTTMLTNRNEYERKNNIVINFSATT